MTDIQSKNDIIRQLENVSDKFSSFCSGISNELFFRQPIEKWSVAQNVTHLITSANMTRLAYRLPKLIIRLYTGKPNRSSRSYDELVAKYKYKLEQGGGLVEDLLANQFPKTMEKKIFLTTSISQ